MNRRPATHEDMMSGRLVFKGNGKTAYRVIEHFRPSHAPTTDYYVIQKLGSRGKTNKWGHALKNFTVED
jgi:negative regulator of replication initiation